jgi:hypothetical protein
VSRLPVSLSMADCVYSRGLVEGSYAPVTITVQ